VDADIKFGDNNDDADADLDDVTVV